MKFLDIYAKGYAGATMGGTSFMVNIEMPENRFSTLENRRNDGYALNILIPEPEYGDEPKFSLVTKLIDKKDGTLSFWGTEEKFNEEEIQLIQNWVKENKIEEQAIAIKNEIKEIEVKIDELYDKEKALYKIKFTTEEELEKRYDEIKLLDKEHEALKRRYDELRGK